jgi:ATP-dependent DNA helicase PIF1
MINQNVELSKENGSNLKTGEEILLFQLSEEQESFITTVLDLRQNVLLIGKAGVGKTTAVRALCEEAERRGLSFAKTAPTGKAAIHIGGETLHRLISKLTSRWGKQDSDWILDFILIDEVSMVRADLLDELSSALKTKMMSNKPFGGVQIVLIGDPGQLPPVVNEKEDEHKYLQAHYLSYHFFGSNGFGQVAWTVMELTKIFRQKDEQFPKLLNLVREGNREKPIAYLNKFRSTDEPKGVILTGRNADADYINKIQLQKLSGEKITYKAIIEGELEKRDWPADYYLDLKVGSKVMVVKNIYRKTGRRLEIDNGTGGTFELAETELALMNGDTGTIAGLDDDCVTFFSDRTQSGWTICRDDGTWEKKESIYNEETKKLEYKVKGTFYQIPLRLAWAVTIHKAQGATIEEVTIDFRKPMFAAGQSYVALSRGVSLDKVWILGRIRPKDIETDPTVADFLVRKLKSEYVGVKPGSQFDIKEEEITTEQANEAFDEMFNK